MLADHLAMNLAKKPMNANKISTVDNSDSKITLHHVKQRTSMLKACVSLITKLLSESFDFALFLLLTHVVA